MARIQSDAVQLALDLVVRETDIDGFFRAFIKTLVEECESRACGVWLLDERRPLRAVDGVRGRPVPRARRSGLGRDGAAARGDGRAPRRATPPAGRQTVEYLPDDSRLPESVRAFNAANGIASVQVAPLALPTHNLGWIALASADASACETTWRRAVLEATARQATLALHQDRLAEQSRREARRQAALEERNRLARDIHDTLTQGFAAILMQLQAAQRSSPALPPQVAAALETAVDLARSHMVEARRSVGALRPAEAGEESLPDALQRIVATTQRTTEIPIRADGQRAAAARRHGARHRRHRAGGADQRRAPLARPVRLPSTPPPCGRSACGCRCRTTAAALRASSARAASA